MSYTMQDFIRDYVKEHFAKLTPQEREEAMRALPAEEQQQLFQSLSPEQRLAGLSAEQIQKYLNELTAHRPAKPRKPRRKK